MADHPDSEQTATTPGVHQRMRRELKTVTAMIRIFCRDHHGRGKTLCENCRQLHDYAANRLAACMFQEHKPTCGSCSVHCYKPSMKKRIIEVMRYSGPRMIFHHPLLACAHLVDQKRCKNKDKKQDHSTMSRDIKS